MLSRGLLVARNPKGMLRTIFSKFCHCHLSDVLTKAILKFLPMKFEPEVNLAF